MLVDALRRIRMHARNAGDGVATARAELLVAGALLVGWFLVTFGIATLWRPIVWAFSSGALLLSACGWRFLWRLFRDGLYELTREDPHGA